MDSDSLALLARPALESFLKPWYQSLEDPQRAQQSTLSKLLQGYQQTRYGAERKADKISTIEEFRSSFPIVTYH